MVWDEFISLDLHTQWLRYLEQFNNLCKISIPRFTLMPHAVRIEFHGFCDTSKDAYGECIYVKSIDNAGQARINLLYAKSKVAPLKTVSLAKLELCGALKLAELHTKVKSAWTKPIDAEYFWTDSTITLTWIHGEACQWKVFVANRVTEIQDLVGKEQWHHVRSEDNPADTISRGIKPTKLQETSLW